MSDWFHDSLYLSTPQEREFFAAATAGLPERDETEPFHCLAHSVRAFRWIMREVKPKVVLEIGFNLGHSACLWLHGGVKRVTSVDIRRTEKMQRALRVIDDRFPLRHEFVHSDSAAVNTGLLQWYPNDLIFIDGGHELENVRTDIALGRKLGVRHFFFDDWQPQFGPGVQPAIAEARLLPLAVFGNMAWCVEPGSAYSNGTEL